MTTYVLTVFDESGARHEVPLDDLSLGYPHVIAFDELAGAHELANSPTAAPPAGRFPVTDEFGNVHLIDFDPQGGTVSGGIVICLHVEVDTLVEIQSEAGLLCIATELIRLVDFSTRRSMAQQADTFQVEFELKECGAPVNISTATLLEGIFRRADKTALVRAGVLFDGPNGKFRVQMQPGDVNSLGTWKAQAHVVLPGGADYHSAVRDFEVKSNLPTS